MASLQPEDLRVLLCNLGSAIQSGLRNARAFKEQDGLAEISYVSTADTIYAIDRISEESITQWFTEHWPADEPVQVVMEGIEDDDFLCFPKHLSPEQTKWKCIIDPIDGTRCIMHDKRSAWALAGIAPQKGEETWLSDIVAACMTELPTTKQWRADQLSATRGRGVTSSAVNVLDGTQLEFTPRPSTSVDFRHGFSWLAKYFPEGRTLIAQIEECLWDEIYGTDDKEPIPIFDDQYLSTGGAFYELLSGHDRMSGDIRPLVIARLGLESPIVCHPYDVCAALILEEAGIIYEHPLGGFPDAPIDTTTPVTWVGYANMQLANLARPAFQNVLNRFLA